MTKRAVIACAVSLAAPSLSAQPADYDFEFVTITHPGNPAFERRSNPNTFGRGSVGYEYRMARSEISTAQWMEFCNAVATRGNIWASSVDPVRWGAILTSTGGALSYALNPLLPDAGRVPVGGIEPTDAAMYANWLHNGKRVDDASLMTGAYQIDNLNFGTPVITNFERLPGAKYWIPTLDEWMKAVYWDPANPAEGGWWEFPNSSDRPPVAGPPGIGETGAGYLDTNVDWLNFRLNQYPETQTPWGLLDATGGAAEMTSTFTLASDTRLYAKGAPVGDDAFIGFRDRADVNWDITFFSGFSDVGLRIASAIPSPASGLVLGFSCLHACRRRRLTH